MSRPDFYFYREPLRFRKEDIDALKYELHQTHKEYEAIIHPLKGRDPHEPEFLEALFDCPDPLNPRSWTGNDAVCDDFFRACEYIHLCTIGLDKATGTAFEQGDHLHEELASED
jgi:hypothetical protein